MKAALVSCLLQVSVLFSSAWEFNQSLISD